MNDDVKFAGKCKECRLDFDLLRLVELSCEHPACPAWTENSLVEAVFDAALMDGILK